MFGNKPKQLKKAADVKTEQKKDNTDTSKRGKHDHDSGVNVTVGSTYKPKHGR